MRILKHHTFVHDEEFPPIETILSIKEIIVAGIGGCSDERKLSVWFWVDGSI